MNRILLPFLFLSLASLTACSTFSIEECKAMDWQQRGYEVGLRGETASQGVRYFAQECKGVPMDAEKFKTGFEAGVKAFCQPARIQQFIGNGGAYQGQCRAEEESPKFQQSLQAGRQEYMINKMTELEKSVKTMTRTIESQEDEISKLKRTIRDQEGEIDRLKRSHP